MKTLSFPPNIFHSEAGGRERKMSSLYKVSTKKNVENEKLENTKMSL